MTYLFKPYDGEIKNDTGNPIPVSGNVEIANDVGNSIPVSGKVAIVDKNGDWNAVDKPVYVNVANPVVTTPDLTSSNYFGEPYSIPITPVVQLDGRYGIPPADTQFYTSGGGTVSGTGGVFKVSSTNTLGSYGLLRSKRFNTYKPGQSMLARWYGVFSNPVAGTSQRMGLNNQENSYWFGYDGVKFGFLHTHSGRSDIHRITINSYTGTQTVTITLNGTPYTVSIQTGETANQAAQRISLINFGNLWLANQRDNTIELLSTSVGVKSGAFSVSSTGNLSATITQVQTGVAATDEWFYAGTDFTLPTWFNPTYYNQYQLKYSWAGLSFFVLNPSTGEFELVYKHLQTDENFLELINPAFKIGLLALNAGGSTPVTVTVASMMSGLEGITNRNNYTGSVSAIKSSLTSTDLHQMVSIQNPYTFNGTINTKELLLEDISVAVQCNDPCQIYMFIDSALSSGLEDFISQDSLPVTVSTSDGLISTSSYFPIVSFIVGSTGSVNQYALDQYRIVVPPGSSITVAIKSSSAIQKAAASIVWYND